MIKTLAAIAATLLFTFSTSVLAANAPPRHEVVETITIAAPIDEVWATVKDFDSLHTWHPMIKSTEASGGNAKGAMRTLTLEDGNTIVEELQKFNEDKMSFKYAIKEMSSVGSLDDHGEAVAIPVVPVSKYIAFITVKAVDGGSEVTWKGKFYRAYNGHHEVPKEVGDEVAVDTVTAIYQSGLNNLKAMLEK